MQSSSFSYAMARIEARRWRERVACAMEDTARDVEAAFPGTRPIWRGHPCLTSFSQCLQPDCSECGRP